MTVLNWVRHGPTHAKVMIGWSDWPADLSDRGRLDWLSAQTEGASWAVSSDLSRARATADALCRPGRLRLSDDPRLREIHFGAWEERSFAEAEATHPADIAAFWQEPGPSAAPGGESWDAMAARVSSAADELARRGGEGLVVAHFGAILSQVQRALGESATKVLARRIEPLSLTRLRWQDGRWQLEMLNARP